MPVSYQNTPSNAGTQVHVTLTDPADANAAGYGGVAAGDWAELLEITAISGLPQPTRGFTDIAALSGRTLSSRGNEAMADVTMTVATDNANPGQALLRANADGQTVIHWRATLADGSFAWWASYVTGFTPSVSDVTGIASTNFTVKPIFEQITGNGLVLSA